MSSINTAAISAKHRGNAEGSVRVLGQTAAVAGISGALLLALKAMVLVAPAVLPGGDGLDALGRPNAAAPVVEPAPVVFEPASTTMPIGSSERTAPSITRTVILPTTTTTTTTKPVTTTKPNTPSTPSTPSTPADKPSSVGGVAAPVTGVVDKVLGTDLTGTVDKVGGAVDGVVDGVNGLAGGATTGLTDTLGLGSTEEAKDGVLPKVSTTLDQTVESLAGEESLVGGLTKGLGLTN